MTLPVLDTARRYTKPALWVAAYLVIAALLGDVTRANIPTWYAGQDKAALNPPDAAFGIVWTALYILLALTGWYLWSRRGEEAARLPLALYAAQMVMNWAWTFVFFHYHQIDLGFYWIAVMNVVILALIVVSWNRYRLVSYWMLPTLLWCSFAAYLNFMIMLLN